MKGGDYKAREGGEEGITKDKGGRRTQWGHTLKMKTQHEINLARWNGINGMDVTLEVLWLYKEITLRLCKEDSQ